MAASAIGKSWMKVLGGVPATTDGRIATAFADTLLDAARARVKTTTERSLDALFAKTAQDRVAAFWAASELLRGH